jgi:hypothetical protein
MSSRFLFIVIPFLPFLRWCAQIETGSNNPEEEEKASD